MKFFYFIQDTFRKTAGILLIAPGVLLLIIAIFGILGDMKKGEDINIGIGVAVFAIVMIIPGIFVYRSGQRQSMEEMKVRQLASILTAYRRLTLAELARKIGLPESETERLLTLAIDQQIIKGHIDRTTGEFFISGSNHEIKNLIKCPYCGAPVSEVFYPGETAKCNACGSLLR